MGKSSAPSLPAPNPAITGTATQSGQTGQDWLNFAKGAYAGQQGQQSNVNTVSGAAENADQAAGTNQGNFGNSLESAYMGSTSPLLGQYSAEAANFGSTGNQDAQAAKAGATVAQDAALAKQQEDQQLQAMGVHPNSGAYVGENNANALNTAVAKAGAETNARQQTQLAGLGLESNAVGLGNAEAVTGLNAIQLGTNENTAAANTALGAANENLAGTGIMNAGFTGDLAGLANEGNLLQSEYNSQLNAAENQQQMQAQQTQSLFGGLGDLAGLGMMAFAPSSRTWKTHKRKAEGNLSAVRSLPIEKWRYKPGIGDGGKHEHVGTYAEDFHRVTGHGDGKRIPVVDAVGITMGAIKELAGEVDKVKKAIASNEPKVPHKAPGGIAHKPHLIAAVGIKPPHEKMPHIPHVHARSSKQKRFSILRKGDVA